jgi:hypothetical protein
MPSRRVLTIALIEATLIVVALVVASLVLVVAGLLGPILIVAIALAPLVVVVVLVISTPPTILWEVLSRLEGLCAWLESIRSRRSEPPSPSLLGIRIVVEVQLLLGLSRQIIVLGGGVIFPRVKVGHICFWGT